MADVQLKINLTGNKEAQQALETLIKQAKETGKQVSNTGAAFDSIKKGAAAALGSVQNIASSLFSLKGLIAAAGAAFATSKLIDAANAQEDAINKVNAALAQSGEFSQEASQEIQDFAAQIQATSKVGDEAALEIFALASSFGLSKDQAKLATQASVDFAAATGKSANEAVKAFASSLSGEVGELGKVNPALKTLTKEQLANGEAIRVVAKQYEGFSQKTLATFSGATAQARNAFGDLLEELGFFITKNPVVIAAVNSSQRLFKSLGEVVSANREAFTQFVISGVNFLIDGFSSAIKSLSSFIQSISFLAPVLSAAINIFRELGSIALTIAATIVRGWAELADVLNLGGVLSFVGKSFANLGIVAVATIRNITEAAGLLASAVGASGIAKSLEGITSSLDEAGVAAATLSDKIDQSNVDLSTGLRKSASAIDTLTAGLNNLGSVSGDQLSNLANESAKSLNSVANTLDTGVKKSINDTIKAQAEFANGFTNTAKASKKSAAQIAADNQKLKDQSVELIRFQNELRDQIRGLGKTGVANPFEAIEVGLDRIDEKFQQIRPRLTQKQIAEFESQLSIAATVNAVSIGAGFAAQITKGAEGARNALVQGGRLAGNAILPGLGEAVGPIIDAFSQGPDAVRQMVREFAQALPTFVNNVILAIPVFIEELVNAIPQIISGILKSLPVLIKALVNSIPTIIKALVNAIPDIVLAFIDFLIFGIPDIILAVIKSIPDIIVAIVKAIPTIINRIIQGLPQIFAQIIAAIPSIFAEIISNIPNIIFALIASIPTIITEFIKNIPKIVSGLLGGLLPGFEKGGGLISGAGSIFSNLVGGAGQGLFNILTSAGGQVFNLLKSGGQAIFNAGDQVLHYLRSGAATLLSAIESIGQTFFNAVKTAATFVSDVFSATGQFIFNIFRNAGYFIFDAIRDASSNLFRTIVNAGQSFFDVLKDLPKIIINGLVDLLKKINPFSSSGFASNIPILGDVLGGIGGFVQEIPVIGDVFGGFFAKGGFVPEGFPADSFPARLTSGEFVIDNSLTPKLENFLNSSQNQPTVAADNTDLLLRILDQVQRPIQTQATVQLNQDTLADIILTLNRTNRRLA